MQPVAPFRGRSGLRGPQLFLPSCSGAPAPPGEAGQPLRGCDRDPEERETDVLSVPRGASRAEQKLPPQDLRHGAHLLERQQESKVRGRGVFFPGLALEAQLLLAKEQKALGSLLLSCLFTRAKKQQQQIPWAALAVGEAAVQSLGWEKYIHTGRVQGADAVLGNVHVDKDCFPLGASGRASCLSRRALLMNP